MTLGGAIITGRILENVAKFMKAGKDSLHDFVHLESTWKNGGEVLYAGHCRCAPPINHLWWTKDRPTYINSGGTTLEQGVLQHPGFRLSTPEWCGTKFYDNDERIIIIIHYLFLLYYTILYYISLPGCQLLSAKPYQGRAQDFSLEAKTEELKAKSGGDRVFGKGAATPSPPARFGLEPRSAQRYSSPLFSASTQDDLSWHYDIVNCGLPCSYWRARPPCPLAYATGTMKLTLGLQSIAVAWGLRMGT